MIIVNSVCGRWQVTIVGVSFWYTTTTRLTSQISFKTIAKKRVEKVFGCWVVLELFRRSLVFVAMIPHSVMVGFCNSPGTVIGLAQFNICKALEPQMLMKPNVF